MLYRPDNPPTSLLLPTSLSTLAAASSSSASQDATTRDMEQIVVVGVGEGGERGTGVDFAGGPLSSSSSAAPSAADRERQQRLKEMEERALRQQQVERQRFLLNLDPGTWEQMAEEGYFQKAEVIVLVYVCAIVFLCQFLCV